MTAVAVCPLCDQPCEPDHVPHELKCTRVGDHLVIAIDTDTLCHAARASQLFYDMAQDGQAITITDPDAFADAVAQALNDEGETGDTPITRIFDAAIERAVESDGGIEIAFPGIAQET